MSSQNTYDELGRLLKKQIGLVRNGSSQNSYNSTPLVSMEYSDNIRGWLRGINNIMQEMKMAL